MSRDSYELLKWRVYHTYDSRQSAFGFPDLVMVRDKRLIFAELKSKDGRLTPEQYEWLYDLQMAGEECYLWTPADWQEIEATL